ncbi:chloride channel protein, partial [Burkholderia cenocepacia]|nr:chloride channel protein [Burkholderia cenocepacia]
VTEPQDANAAPADPLDTLRDEDDSEPAAAAAADSAAHAPTPHDAGPAATDANGPAQQHGPRDAQ